MDKISFKNDYSEGAHELVLAALAHANTGVYDGYGEDTTTQNTVAVMKKTMNMPTADIHFLTGGTQTNLVMISAALRPYEAVISTDIGHIATHEAGAIEATGHKVLTVKTKDGKLTGEAIEKIVEMHTDEHMVLPRMVYISNSTENGLAYKKKELQELRAVCDRHQLYLFMDGARLGSALCSPQNDLTLSEVASMVDAFYIGGTKNGILFGEALVLCNPKLKEHFRFHIKQRGAMLAKGWVISVQFLALFEKDLYFKLAQHANTMAQTLGKGLAALGVSFSAPIETNQMFPILDKKVISALEKKYDFHFWAPVDENKDVVRFVTSWATKEAAVNALLQDVAHFVADTKN